MHRIRGKLPLNLYSQCSQIQAGKKQVLSVIKEENHIQPFLLFIIFIKSVQKGTQDSSGRNLKGPRNMVLDRETNPVENK